MALVKCPECGKDISDTTKKCIHCGYKIKKRSSEVDKSFDYTKVWEKKARARKIGKYVLILIILLGIILSFIWYRSKCVPYFAGINVEEAKAWLEKREIPYTISYEYTDNYDKDIVYDQSVAAGFYNNSDEKIVLYASSGKMYTVPDIVGKNINELDDTLKYIPYTATYEYTDDKEEGTILSLSEKVGEKFTPETILEIKVSQGIYTVIPDLNGKRVEEATKILGDLGVEVKVKKEVSLQYDEGIVTTYSPKKIGDASTTTIILQVSAGKGVFIHDMVGISETALKHKDYDFDYKIVNGYGDLDNIDCNDMNENEARVTAQNMEGLVLLENASNLEVELSKPAIQLTSGRMELNYVGGVDTYFTIKNVSDKQIAYVILEVKYYDKMGNAANCDINKTSIANLEYTGPLNAGKSASSTYWRAVIYDSSCAAMKPLSARIEFSDGSVQNLKFNGRYWHTNRFYDGYPKD